LTASARPQVLRFNGLTKVLLALAFLLIFGVAEAYAAVSGAMLYRMRYTSEGDKSDQAVAIAIGPRNTVYLTGTSGSDYATIKYSRSGALRWVSRYTGPELSSPSHPSAMAVDSRGNVYVTGSSPGVWTGLDFATVKYGPRGGLRWVKRFNDKFGGNDMAKDIVVGSTGVYVTGASPGLWTQMDYTTIKYGFDGRKLWIKRYNSPGNDEDTPAKIAVDGSDNVYVTGTSASDYATVKYSPAGRLRWVRKYDGPANNMDAATDLAVDVAGNVYVTGASNGPGGPMDSDIATVKYNTAGVKQWAQRYDGPAHGSDYGTAIKVDRGGNVYMAGSSSNAPGTADGADYVTIKYNSAGAQQWLQRQTDFELPAAMTLDKNNNVYVTGEDFSSGMYGSINYGTVKYDTNGNPLWIQAYKGPTSNLNLANDIAVDRAGAAYVTGSSLRMFDMGFDYMTVKYAP